MALSTISEYISQLVVWEFSWSKSSDCIFCEKCAIDMRAVLKELNNAGLLEDYSLTQLRLT